MVKGELPCHYPQDLRL